VENKLKAAREARHWSQLRLLSELVSRGHAQGISMPSHTSLKTAISRWENGHHIPQEPYSALLAEIFETTPAALGMVLGKEAALSAVDDLRADLDLRDCPDSTLEGSLGWQTEAIRVQDRQYGARSLLDQLRGHVVNIEQHLARVFHADLGDTRPGNVKSACLVRETAACEGRQSLTEQALVG
jgi:transcriptional regulator with XRE-family HTH domain